MDVKLQKYGTVWAFHVPDFKGLSMTSAEYALLLCAWSEQMASLVLHYGIYQGKGRVLQQCLTVFDALFKYLAKP